MGEQREGISYETVTVDDFVYANPNTSGISQDEYKILGPEDYYFTKVSVSQWDKGYDPWEDRYTEPEEPAVGDAEEKGLVIYAMFAEENPNQWQEVAVVPWSAGTMTYQFTQEQIAKEPWRVMAVHRTTNYSTACDINVTMTIRHDSEAFAEFVDEVSNEDIGTAQSLSLENLGGVMVQLYDNETPGEYLQNGEDGGYEEPGLKEASQKLYGTLPGRDNASVSLTSLSARAEAGKSGTSWNDPVNGRVHLQYNLTAYDGYEVYGEEAIDYLKE